MTNSIKREENVEIDGFLFFAHDVTATESYSRREYVRTKILGGSEFVARNSFIPKEYTFTADVYIDPTKPDAYDKVFSSMNNKPCKVTSRYMGMFTAEVNVTKTHNKSSPGNISLSILVREIPSTEVDI